MISASPPGNCMTKLQQLPEPHVLVIDDDRAVCDVVVRILRRAGFDATATYDAVSGVRAAEDTGPDLILVDLKMEHVDGLMALRLLRAQAPTCVILAFTGALIDDEPLLFEGFDGVIHKPIFAFDLVERVVHALDSAATVRRRGLNPAELLSNASQRLRTA